ncbi:MAG: hypothetical protein HY682_00185 [Chloroflexi bacterium]|nr:hypothetical protein [Chloroflexota bacterium]
MNRFRRTSVLAVAVLILPLAAWAVTASPGEILNDPDRFDGKLVTVTGSVTVLKAKISGKGNAYYTFTLDDAGRAITVFSFGKPECPEGRTATVEGQFQKVKRVGRYVFRNQIDAVTVRCR